MTAALAFLLSYAAVAVTLAMLGDHVMALFRSDA
jgi:hypothetical protein